MHGLPSRPAQCRSVSLRATCLATGPLPKTRAHPERLAAESKLLPHRLTVLCTHVWIGGFMQQRLGTTRSRNYRVRV